MERTIESTALQDTEQRPLRILLVSTADQGGGAEQSAWNLFKSYRNLGHSTFLAVGDKRTNDPNVIVIPNDASRSLWARVWLSIGYRLSEYAGHSERLDYWLRAISEPRRWLETERGYEDYHFPGTYKLLQLLEPPDIVHCYNLHGGYFDLRALASLSHRLPIIVDLRDAWLLSGHCAHSLGCERWKGGCGQCPDLTIPYAIKRDATAYNWRRKRDVFASSRLYVSTPSRWLMQKVEQSILVPAIADSQIIPTGVDLSTFRASDKSAARSALNLPQQANILLFAGNGVRGNVWKDYDTIKAAISLVRNQGTAKNLLFIALGENGSPERVGEAEIRFISHQNSSQTVARYYQAADLYVHAARVETFPRAVLEALACGTPVVATAVGGIPEQIKTLQISHMISHIDVGFHRPEEATGILVLPGEAGAMAAAIEHLLSNDHLCRQLAANAARDARKRFDLQAQVDRYMNWYRTMMRSHRDFQTAAKSSLLALNAAGL